MTTAPSPAGLLQRVWLPAKTPLHKRMDSIHCHNRQVPIFCQHQRHRCCGVSSFSVDQRPPSQSVRGRVACLQTSVAHFQLHHQSYPLRGAFGASVLLVLWVRVRHHHHKVLVVLTEHFTSVPFNEIKRSWKQYLAHSRVCQISFSSISIPFFKVNVIPLICLEGEIVLLTSVKCTLLQSNSFCSS